MILLSVPLTLLLLRNNLIPLHQSSNFVQSPSNHLGSGTMLLGIPADSFTAGVTAGVVAGAVDISVSVCLLLEASSLICKDSSRSDNTSISFVLLKLVLASCSLHYMCFVSSQVTLSSIVRIHLSCKVSSLMLYQM